MFFTAFVLCTYILRLFKLPGQTKYRTPHCSYKTQITIFAYLGIA